MTFALWQSLTVSCIWQQLCLEY